MICATDEEHDGGPAFPGTAYGAIGMSMRDYFAAKAMQALFDSDAGHSAAEMGMIAAESYEMADAMLAERAK